MLPAVTGHPNHCRSKLSNPWTCVVQYLLGCSVAKLRATATVEREWMWEKLNHLGGGAKQCSSNKLGFRRTIICLHLLFYFVQSCTVCFPLQVPPTCIGSFMVKVNKPRQPCLKMIIMHSGPFKSLVKKNKTREEIQPCPSGTVLVGLVHRFISSCQLRPGFMLVRCLGLKFAFLGTKLSYA